MRGGEDPEESPCEKAIRSQNDMGESDRIEIAIVTFLQKNPNSIYLEIEDDLYPAVPGVVHPVQAHDLFRAGVVRAAGRRRLAPAPGGRGCRAAERVEHHHRHARSGRHAAELCHEETG
jgi:hypothetical protein